VINSCLCYC